MAQLSKPDAETRIVTIDPYEEILLRQANEMKYRDEYTEAIRIYDQVLLTNPCQVKALHSKGNALDMLGRYDEAISCYESALEFDPGNAETWYNKGLTLKNMGCENEASECMKRGISIATGY
jgi:tetratricopeptide (TPR) repeat protein